MLLRSVRQSGGILGVIFDLTNTNRFYDAESEVRANGIVYYKLPCRGHGEAPSPELTQEFICRVEGFVRKNPTQLIGVHCTHGFNRTGFLICAYLIDKLDFSVDMAVTMFAAVRPPGIYKQMYIDELFKRYARDEPILQIAGNVPTWDTDDTVADGNNEDDASDDGDAEDEEEAMNGGAQSSGESNSPVKRKGRNNTGNKRTNKRARLEGGKLNPQFAEPIQGSLNFFFFVK